MAESPTNDCLVAVCVVSHDSAADLPDCLRAVAALRHRPLELVIVDCTSLDESVRTARQNLPRGLPAHVVSLAENLGFACGR